jgi:hypothetical protein
MIMDNFLMLDGSNSSAGVFTGTAVNSGTTFTVGNQASANIIDMSQIASSAKGYGRDIAVGDDLELVSLVIVTFTGSSSTMQLQVQYAPDNGSGSPGSYVTVAQTPALTLAQLVAGAEVWRTKLPPQMPAGVYGTAIPKFLQMNYVVGTANMTAGAIATFICIDKTALGPQLGYQSGYSNQYL